MMMVCFPLGVSGRLCSMIVGSSKTSSELSYHNSINAYILQESYSITFKSR